MGRDAKRIKEAVQGFEAAGHPVRGLRLYANGSVDLLTEAPVISAPEDDRYEWVELGAQAKK
jgi:hypothetical protein